MNIHQTYTYPPQTLLDSRIHFTDRVSTPIFNPNQLKQVLLNPMQNVNQTLLVNYAPVSYHSAQVPFSLAHSGVSPITPNRLPFINQTVTFVPVQQGQVIASQSQTDPASKKRKISNICSSSTPSHYSIPVPSSDIRLDFKQQQFLKQMSECQNQILKDPRLAIAQNQIKKEHNTHEVGTISELQIKRPLSIHSIPEPTAISKLNYDGVTSSMHENRSDSPNSSNGSVFLNGSLKKLIILRASCVSCIRDKVKCRAPSKCQEGENGLLPGSKIARPEKTIIEEGDDDDITEVVDKTTPCERCVARNRCCIRIPEKKRGRRSVE